MPETASPALTPPPTSAALAPSGAAPVAPPTPGPDRGLRGFDDVGGLRTGIYDSVFKAVSEFEPVANATHTVKLVNPKWVDPPDLTPKDRKRAILRNESLGRRLQAEWHLIDNASGQKVAARRSVVATVPKLTDGGTFVQDGIEYTLANQFRLLPGVYTRRKSTGETESHVNVLPGQGVSHRHTLDPVKSVFKMEVGQSSVPLLPVLRAMGATDDQLREAWGDKLLAANQAHDTPEALTKLYDRLLNAAERKAEPDKAKAVAAAILKMRLDPSVTTRTLGRPHETLGVDAVLDSTKRLLSVYRGEAEPDDRDAMPYQKLMAPDDLMAERVRAGRSTVRKLLWKATNKKSLAPFPTGLFDGHIKGLLQGSGLATAAEEVNPLEMLGQMTRVTRLGEGGISGGSDAIPEECYDNITEVFTRSGWKKWADVTEADLFACQVDGRIEFHRARRLIAKHYIGVMYGIRTRTLDHLVTPGHRLWVRKVRGTGGKARCGLAPWTFETAAEGYRRPREFQIRALPYLGQPIETFDVPFTPGQRQKQVTLPIDDLAELTGWFVSEGSLGKKSVSYATYISQDATANPKKTARIEALLTRLGISHSYQGHNFVFYGKQLYQWFQKLGRYAHEKRLPEECFDWPLSARLRLFEALLAGDGHTRDNGYQILTSTSSVLIEQFVRLACGLGRPVSVAPVRVHENENWRDCYQCRLLSSEVQGVTDTRQYDTNYYQTEYDGMVYCAEVPGELLLVRRNGSTPMWSGNSRDVHSSQLGYVDPVLTPESGRAGVDLKLAGAARRGRDGRLYTPVRDLRTGQVDYRSPLDLADEPVAFPGEMKGDDPVVTVVHKGRIDRLPRDQVRYEVPHMETAFNPLANLVPGKSAIKGQRAIMGARMMTQAMALKGAETPLVGAADPDSGEAYEKVYGHHVGAVRADQPGRVVAVADDKVTVRGEDGKERTFDLHVNLPYNRKSVKTQTPTVEVGQFVKPGDLLARSNYTDDKGHIALGRNLYAAYVPDGNNFEDAVTISASAARDKLVSEHLYQHSAEHSDDVKRGKNSFIALMPSTYSRAQLSSLDDDGVIKPGSVVESGQPLVLGARLKSRTRTKILRGGADAFSNDTQEWDHYSPGVVTDVEKTPKGVVVAVKAYNPMIEGDKLSGRFGDKGLVKIVPDEHMPHDSQGRPFEVLLNPLGVQTRGNPIQVYETVLSKIAKATGKPYALKDFDDIADLQEYTQREAEKHGVSDTETITDPRTGVKIPGVLTGYRYMMKLHHAAEDKDQGRGLGGYTADGEPARGSGDGGGAKRFSVWDTWAMLSHGALAGIRDAKQVRGQKNEDYWAMFQAGHRPPDPDVPHAYKKFVSDLRAAGINPVRQGTKTRLLGMTDKDVDALTEGRVVQSAESVNWNEGLDPIRGGLFDQALTGSHGGKKWSAIQLHEPVLNPVFEDPARRLLGLTKVQLREVMAGDRQLNGQTGHAGLHAALKAIDVPKELEKAKAEFRSGKKTRRDEAVKRWALLEAADKHSVHPGDWVLSKVPVLPPVFRPVSLMQGNGRPMTADANLLYKELFDANHNLKQLSQHSDQLRDERLAVYDAFKGVVGLGDPTDPKNKERGVSGILKSVFGSSPKYSHVQRKLLGTTVDTVGRSVIVPNADLDMDQAGIPENKAWDVFKPFVVRRLVRQGMTPVRAAEMISNKDQVARRALQAEMEARPIRVTRAPILHRYGTMAFRPVLVPGHSIHLPPVVYKGFGADNDGDQVNYHVPVSDDAVKEDLEKLLPSKNLFNVRNFSVHQLPQNEFLAGLYEATQRENDTPPVPFDSVESVVRALRRGHLRHDQRVTVPQ